MNMEIMFVPSEASIPLVSLSLWSSTTDSKITMSISGREYITSTMRIIIRSVLPPT